VAPQARPQGRRKYQKFRRHTIIEMMRQGKSPTDACLEAMPASRTTTKTTRKSSEHSQSIFTINKDARTARIALAQWI